MQTKPKISFSKRLIFIVKLIIAVVLLYFIYLKIVQTYDQTDFNAINFSNNWFYVLAGLLVLTLVNWGIEARKWQILSHSTQSLTFKQAYGSVLSGLATGLVTPNRIGNFIGRNIYIDKEKRILATYQTQLGNLSQFLVSILVGVIGFSLVITWYIVDLNPALIYGLSTIILLIGLLGYYKPELILKTFPGKYLYQKDQSNFDQFIVISNHLKTKILYLSLIRYSVFIIQYNLLFILFSNHPSWTEISTLAATTFLITTLIPSLLFGKLLVRESAALLVFGWAGLPVPVILLVSFSLWFINLALPGLSGLFIWLKKSR